LLNIDTYDIIIVNIIVKEIHMENENNEEIKKQDEDLNEVKQTTKTEEKKTQNEKSKGFGITSMVLGIIAIVFWCLYFISIPCAILAIIFGAIGLKKDGRGMAVAGLVLGIISLVVWVALIGFGALGYSTLNNMHTIVENIDLY
jgi:uncharacterized membrane protein